MRWVILLLMGLVGYPKAVHAGEPIVELQFMRHEVRFDFSDCGQTTNTIQVTNAHLILPISNECYGRQGIFTGEVELEAPPVMYRYVKTNRYVEPYIPRGSIAGAWTRRDTPVAGESPVRVEAQAWNNANFVDGCTVQRQIKSNVTASAAVHIETTCPVESVRYWQDLEHQFSSYMYQNGGNGGGVQVNVLTYYRLVTGMRFPRPEVYLDTLVDRQGNNTTNYIMTSSFDPGGLRINIETNGPNWLSVSTSSIGYTTNAPDVFQTRVSIFANYYQLPVGQYEKKVSISSLTSTNTVEFTVYFKVNPFPVMTLSRDSFSFQFDVRNTNGTPQSLEVRHTGKGGILEWTATAVTTNGGNWLLLGSTEGTALTNSPSTLSFYANPAGLAAGTYEGAIQFGGNAKNLPKQARVSLIVTERGRLGIPGPMTFLGTTVSNPPPQRFAITNFGGEKVSWQVYKPNSTYSFLSITRVDGETALQGQLEPDQVLEFNAQAWTTNTRGGTFDGTISVFGDYFAYEQNIPITVVATNVSDRLTLREVTPVSGQLLSTATTNNFQGTVAYQLTSSSTADVALRLFDQEGVLQGSSEFLRVRNETALKTNVFKMTNVVIGTNVSRLVLKAVLIEPFSLRVIQESELYEYAVKAPLETTLGTKNVFENEAFQPLQAPFPDLRGGSISSVPPDSANFYTLRIDDPDLEAGDLIEILRSTRVETNGVLQTAEGPSLLVDFPVSNNGEKPLIPLVEIGIKPFVDYWTVQARLIRAGKEMQRSVEYRVRVNTLEVTIDPVPKTILTEGSSVPFKFKVEFRGGGPGSIILSNTTRTASSANARQEIKWDVSSPFYGIRDYSVTREVPVGREGRIQFDVSYRTGPTVLKSRFYYDDFGSKPFSFAEGAKAVSELVGVDINTLKNTLVNLVPISAGRTKERVEIAVGLGFLKSWEPKRMSLKVASPPADLVTISNTWFFKPSIVETGVFSAELSLHYAIEDLPETVAARQTEMRAIAYYEVLDEWEIIPAQIDVGTKTATFPVDRLADFYSLGVQLAPSDRLLLSFATEAGALILEANTTAVLQTSTGVAGLPWIDTPATGLRRWTNQLTGPQRFFRLRAP